MFIFGILQPENSTSIYLHTESIQYTHAAANIILVLSLILNPQTTYTDYLLSHHNLTDKMQLIIIFPELHTIWSQTIIILTQEGQWPRLVLDKIPVITIRSDKNNNTFF